MKLDSIVPFGRSLEEYRLMFSLTPADLEQKIIGVGDGPASFNAEMHALGRHVVSVDPVYQFDAIEIRNRFYAVVESIIAQITATPHDWVWSFHHSPENLRTLRIAALDRFVADFDVGKNMGRYVVGEVPQLEFRDHEFDLALCSNFLFLYSDHLTYDFHRAAVFEMLRIAPEVRVFPLLTLARQPSVYLDPLVRELQAQGHTAEVTTVAYELQRGGNQMLTIRRGH